MVKYRAILIDPEQQTFTEVMIGRDNIQQLYQLLHCQSITTGAHLSGNLRNGFESILVSDDLLEERDDPHFWFQVDAERDPPSSFPVAGFGLANGVDPDGYTCDLKISIDDLSKRVTFTRRKFRGVTVALRSSTATARKAFTSKWSRLRRSLMVATRNEMMVTLETLVEKFPACFFIHQARRRPLKLKIHEDVMAALGVTRDDLSAAFWRYCSNEIYLRRCREGAGRIDLNGEIVGWVTADEAKQCADKLAGIAKRRATTKPTEAAAPSAAPAAPAPARISLSDLKESARARKAMCEA